MTPITTGSDIAHTFPIKKASTPAAMTNKNKLICARKYHQGATV